MEGSIRQINKSTATRMPHTHTHTQELCLLPNRSKVTELMRAPALIGDARLRAEVAACIAQDGDFSPGADLVSRSLGRFVCGRVG